MPLSKQKRALALARQGANVPPAVELAERLSRPPRPRSIRIVPGAGVGRLSVLKMVLDPEDKGFAAFVAAIEQLPPGVRESVFVVEYVDGFYTLSSTEDGRFIGCYYSEKRR